MYGWQFQPPAPVYEAVPTDVKNTAGSENVSIGFRKNSNSAYGILLVIVERS
jgi:hypothetical protein